MKKILFIVPLLAILFMASAMTGCRFAKSYEDGDTVAASVFEPEDTTIAAAKRRHAAAKAAAIIRTAPTSITSETDRTDSSCNSSPTLPSATHWCTARPDT